VHSLAILQARMSSTRLPGKVLTQMNDQPMIKWQIDRILRADIDALIVVTSVHQSDDVLASYLEDLGMPILRGSLDDVHSRYLSVVEKFEPEFFLRLTADCPLVMPNIINQMISAFQSEKYDYYSNTLNRTFPDGLDIEIVDTQAFREFSKNNLSAQEKEHVTIGMVNRRSKFVLGSFEQVQNLSDLRWTVDYPEDLEFVREIYNRFKGRETEFTYSEVLNAIGL
jgi:spore coat polysaccharide biosynthesis protein SpsF